MKKVVHHPPPALRTFESGRGEEGRGAEGGPKKGQGPRVGRHHTGGAFLLSLLAPRFFGGSGGGCRRRCAAGTFPLLPPGGGRGLRGRLWRRRGLSSGLRLGLGGGLGGGLGRSLLSTALPRFLPEPQPLGTRVLLSVYCPCGAAGGRGASAVPVRASPADLVGKLTGNTVGELTLVTIPEGGEIGKGFCHVSRECLVADGLLFVPRTALKLNRVARWGVQPERRHDVEALLHVLGAVGDCVLQVLDTDNVVIAQPLLDLDVAGERNTKPGVVEDVPSGAEELRHVRGVRETPADETAEHINVPHHRVGDGDEPGLVHLLQLEVSQHPLHSHRYILPLSPDHEYQTAPLRLLHSAELFLLIREALTARDLPLLTKAPLVVVHEVTRVLEDLRQRLLPLRTRALRGLLRGVRPQLPVLLTPLDLVKVHLLDTLPPL
eukprot:Hpha_TRINITY_DN16657_c1_g5::TRINITY_DN16657_c1_g5_i1::g.178450::m.178450